jgi:hypothetical protein
VPAVLLALWESQQVLQALSESQALLLARVPAV